MLIWIPTTVDQEPSTTLVWWAVMQFADGDRSFVGYAVESREGRVSSAVRTFDPKTLRGVTDSGRVYRLQGRPGLDSEGSYVWNRYVAGYNEANWTDVTASVWSEHITSLEAQVSPVTSAADSDGAGHA